MSLITGYRNPTTELSVPQLVERCWRAEIVSALADDQCLIRSISKSQTSRSSNWDQIKRGPMIEVSSFRVMAYIRILTKIPSDESPSRPRRNLANLNVAGHTFEYHPVKRPSQLPAYDIPS